MGGQKKFSETKKKGQKKFPRQKNFWKWDFKNSKFLTWAPN